MKQKNFYFYTNLLAWGLVLFLVGNYVFAWTTPSQDPPGGNIVLETGATPAGSTGYIQFNDAGNLGADSNLSWDNTNKRLGIGTTGPESGIRLHVVGGNFKLGNTNALYMQLNGATDARIWTSNMSNGLLLQPAGGNVGIGTTSPGTAKLKISGGVLDMTSQKIINLATPTADTDATTKAYVDSKSSGPMDWTCITVCNNRWSNNSYWSNAQCPAGYRLISGGCWCTNTSSGCSNLANTKYCDYLFVDRPNTTSQRWECAQLHYGLAATALCCK